MAANKISNLTQIVLTYHMKIFNQDVIIWTVMLYLFNNKMFYFSKTIQKNLDPSNKMDLDFLDSLHIGLAAESHKTDLLYQAPRL